MPISMPARVEQHAPVLTFAQSIHDALATALAADPGVVVFGLGTDDPKGVFGTTLDLHKEFGADRVFDTPTSENALTGIAVGMALAGQRPIFTHQRLDFALLSLDQIVNNAAKWHFMFGGKRSVPIVIRMIIGRGWGQGPTHSQNLQALFAHIPGLKVVMPSFADDAKGLLLESIFDDSPVIFLEHRWLHNGRCEVPEGDYRVPLGKARQVREGKDLTIVAASYTTVEAVHAADFLKAHNMHVDLIDLRTIRPIDWPTISTSLKKTGRLLVLDSGHETCGVAGEIIARMATEHWSDLKAAPRRLTAPDVPEATSPALTHGYHIRAEHIAKAVAEMLGVPVDTTPLALQESGPHDVPGAWFTGPF
jgi:acetoin:2,6-dichlorophenolindophenol oxidoreductase subunit beta